MAILKEVQEDLSLWDRNTSFSIIDMHRTLFSMLEMYPESPLQSRQPFCRQGIHIYLGLFSYTFQPIGQVKEGLLPSVQVIICLSSYKIIHDNMTFYNGN